MSLRIDFTPTTSTQVQASALEAGQRVKIYTSVPNLGFSGSVEKSAHYDVLVLSSSEGRIRQEIDVRIIVAIEFLKPSF